MKRYALLSAAVVAVVPTMMLAGQVNLQDSTPGTQQIGHINVSGSIRAGAVVGYSNQTTGIAYGGDFRSVSSQGRGVLGNASSTTGVTYGGLFQSFSTQGRGVAGITVATTGSTVGGFFTSNSINGKGVQGSSNATSGLNYGVYGRNVSPDGFALYAEGNVSSTGNFGIGMGTTPVSERLIVAGNAQILGTISGNGTLLTNLNASALASGTVSNDRLSSNVARRDEDNAFFGLNIFNNPTGFGVFSDGNVGLTGNLGIGIGSATPQTRIQIADDNPITQGSIRINNGSTTTTLQGGRTGLVAYVGGANFPIGVAAIAQSTDGTTSWGLRGIAVGTGLNYGVWGTAQNGTTNWAGYFDGNLFATSANAGVKAFMIDHPMDPANKVLMHSSVESDERKNIYDGLVTTDDRGFATVTMPTWFEALNVDFRYQLTIIDDEGSESFTQAKIVKRLVAGKFRIRTSAPQTTVSWQITGRRHDPTSNHYPLEVERMKNKDERGKYYVPEAYGKDPSFGVAHRPQQKETKRPLRK